MNKNKIASLFAVAAVILATPLISSAKAENLQKAEDPNAPKQPTVITSDGPLEVDYTAKTAFFNQNVVVVDTHGTVHADIMKVYFTDDSKDIDHIYCKGNVKIEQPERHSESDEALYEAREERMVLTGNPVIKQGKDQYRADKITIFTKQNRVIFEPSAQLIVYPDKKEKSKTDLFAHTDQADTDDNAAADPAGKEEK